MSALSSPASRSRRACSEQVVVSFEARHHDLGTDLGNLELDCVGSRLGGVRTAKDCEVEISM